MHHTLQIQEILLNIFGHCLFDSDVAALARTCRAFKEPALDVLWEELNELFPLVRCVPKASRLSSKSYTFHRSLTQTEWDILRSYTRRIRSINLEDDIPGIDRNCFISLVKPNRRGPLFLNVRNLRFQYPDDKHLLLASFPSLRSLDIQLNDPGSFEDSLKLFAKTSPSLTSLSIDPYHYAIIDMDRIDPKFICHWRNLQTFSSSKMSLEMTTLVHLSRLPALISLSFTLRSTLPDQISPSDSPLIFFNLDRLLICSEFLGPVSHLLSQTRLPAVTDLTAYIDSRPARQDLSLFLSNVRASCSPPTIQALRLTQPYTSLWGRRSAPVDKPVLGLEDLGLYMPFSNLRRIQLDIKWKVDLTDSELLTLVSTWRRLEELSINAGWGWNTFGGVTPNGLLQLLQSCPLLTEIALAIDMRAEIPSLPTSLGFLPRLYRINVVDSFIEEESVPAIAAFITCLVDPSKIDFRAWDSFGMEAPYSDVCWEHWRHVEQRVRGAGQLR